MIPKKSFGQHFLRDRSVVKRILDAVPLDVYFLVEVGPGEGVLTGELVKRMRAVPEAQRPNLLLIEADRDLIQPLRDEFPNADVIFGDAARVQMEQYVHDQSWVFLGNLPYNAAAAILMNMLTTEHPPETSVIMVQKEQADRMLANPGEMSLLSVAVQMYAEPVRLFHVPPGAFFPPPKVDSSVLLLKRRNPGDNAERVISLAKAGFANRRKQLHKNLSQAGMGDAETVKRALQTLQLPVTARAQELSLEQWKKLTHAVNFEQPPS